MTLGQIILVALIIATLIICSKIKEHGNKLSAIEDKVGIKPAKEKDEE